MIDLLNTDTFLMFFGTFFLVLGFSCFFAKKAWEDFFALLVEHESLSLVLGILILPVALFIVFFYNQWEGLSSTMLMVIGYLAFVKSVVLLAKPSLVQKIMQKRFVKKWVWLDGVSGVVMGLALLFL